MHPALRNDDAARVLPLAGTALTEGQTSAQQAAPASAKGFGTRPQIAAFASLRPGAVADACSCVPRELECP